MKPKKMIEDGMVAVLYSPGYGSGWSTWAHSPEIAKFMTFDQRLVLAAQRKANVDEVNELLTDIFGPETYVGTGGWDQIEISWVEQGTIFEIAEYDGAEHIRFYNAHDYYTA